MVLWCDSDIILAGPVGHLLADRGPEWFVATEDYSWGKAKGSRLRVAGWNLTEERPLAATVNSCFMRVTP